MTYAINACGIDVKIGVIMPFKQLPVPTVEHSTDFAMFGGALLSQTSADIHSRGKQPRR